MPTDPPPQWVTTLIVAEKCYIPPWAFEPETPRIIWYYRALALNNARASHEASERRKQERKSRSRK